MTSRFAPATLRALLLAGALAPVLITSAQAGRTQRFTDDSLGDFRKGDVTTSTLTDLGILTVPPTRAKLYRPAALEGGFWSGIAREDGTAILGSGSQGRVVALDSNSSGTVITKLDLMQVHALAAAGKDGSFYAAGAPGGKIHRVGPDHKSSVVFDTKESYVWALLPTPSGELYAATGNQGKIYKVAADGSGKEFAKLKNVKNILALAQDREGRLLAATQDKAQLIRFDADGKPFVIYEADQKEIRRVVVGPDGSYWIAVNDRDGGPEGEVPRSSAPVSAASAAIAALMEGPGGGGPGGDGDDDGSSGGGASPSPSPSMRVSSGGGGGRGAAVVLLSPSGFVRMTWPAPEGPVQDIHLDPTGTNLYVAAGTSGALYRIDTQGRSTRVVTLREKSILRIVREPKGSLLLLTNGSAAAYRVSPDQPAEGIFVSTAFDGQMAVEWGRPIVDAKIPAGAKVLFSTRTGNTSDPDLGWSPWSKEVEVSPNEPLSTGAVAARRFQYRLRLTTASSDPANYPRVDRVVVPYVSPNHPPEIKDVVVRPASGGGRGGSSSSAMYGGPAGGSSSMPSKDDGEGGSSAIRRPPTGGGSSGGRGGAEADSNPKRMSVSWKANDPNSDELTAKVFVRPEAESTWVEVESAARGSSYPLDTSLLPDGKYVVRVEIADANTNLPDAKQTAAAESDPFEVDNTEPTISGLAATPGKNGGVRINFGAADSATQISSAQYRINSGEFRFLQPTDGIFDGREESFSFEIPYDDFDAGKTAMITVRATDERGNTRVALVRAEPRK